MEQALQQVFIAPDEISIGHLFKPELCGHYTVVMVQFWEPDSIAIDKKGLVVRMCGAVDLVVDTSWKYFEGLKQAKITGHSGGELKQKGVGGQYVPIAGARGPEWLQGVGRFKALLGEWWPPYTCRSRTGLLGRILG